MSYENVCFRVVLFCLGQNTVTDPEKFPRHFFYWRGILHIDFLNYRRMINATYYCHLLQIVKSVQSNRRRCMLVRHFILLHDHARPHTEVLTRGKLTDNILGTLEHTPYRPDLFLYDYVLFAPKKLQKLRNAHAIG